MKNFVFLAVAIFTFNFSGLSIAEDDCGSIEGIYLYDQLSDQPAYGPIENGASIHLSQLPSEYYLVVTTLGNVESVAWTVDGYEIEENAMPYTFPGGAQDGNSWQGSEGFHNISVSAFNQDNCQGDLCQTLYIGIELSSGCQNATNPGFIEGPSSICSEETLQLTNGELPSGGAGALEYLWLFNPNSADWNGADVIHSNTSSLTFNPSESGWYRRCSRRSGCSDYAAESAWVYVELEPCDAPCTLEVELGDDINFCGDEVHLIPHIEGGQPCLNCSEIEEQHEFNLDIWEANSNGLICEDEFTSTTLESYSDFVSFTDPIGQYGEITSFSMEFHVAACYGVADNQSYSIELNGQVIGQFNPTELPCVYNVCESQGMIHMDLTAVNQAYHFGGENTFDLNFDTQGAHICVANIDVSLGVTTQDCVSADSELTYLWSNGAGSSEISVTQSGIYSVLITDCNGCVTMDEVQVTISPAEEITPQNLTEEITISQGSSIPEVTFDNGEIITYSENEASSSCMIELSSNTSYNWRNLWFHEFPEEYNKHFLWENGYVLINADGTAEIFGKITNVDLPESGFHLHYYFEELVDFSTWVSGGGYENTDADAQDRLYASVDFTKPNSIVGFGTFEDSNLSLISTGNVAHMDYGPRDVYGGFGVGFWIDYEGTVNGTPVGNSAADSGANHNDMYSAIGECVESPEADCEDLLVRHWVVENECGVQCSFVQYVTITDTEPPVLVNGPEDMISECSGEMPNVETPEFSDNNQDELEIIFEEQIEELSCGFEVIRTWTATDACGNSTSYTQTISANDTEAPVLLGVPADETVSCDEEISNALVFAQDNCSADLTVLADSQTEYLDCGSQITRTWTTVDDCGNETIAIQVVTIIDSQSPVFLPFEEEIYVNCGQDNSTDVQAEDNCSTDILMTYSDDIQQGECLDIVIRTWTATDECGNQSQATQTLIEQDLVAPTLEGVPADSQANCDDIPEPASVSATDNCSENVEVNFNEEIEGDDCPYSIIRTWIATDDCGNETAESQTITVFDSENPTLVGVPEDMNAEMGNVPSAPTVTATDNCSQVEVNFEEQELELVCGYQIIRTWTAEDECGNITTDSQTITLSDNLPPVAEPLQDLSVECGNVIPDMEPVFTDATDENLEIEFSEQTESLDCGYVIERTWIATDDCGNTAEASQTITVTDNTAPVLLGLPNDEEIDCNSNISDAIVVATDNCDENLQVSLVSETIELDCGYQILRTWSVSDACGNETTASQLSTFTDVTAPMAVISPEDVDVECGSELPSTEPVFSDNCSDVIEVTSSQQIEANGLCGYMLIKTWIATDECGNETTVSQNITVVDTSEPEMIGCPEDEEVSCDEIPEPPQVSATDNCDDDVDVQFNEQINSDNCPYTIERTWTATDACGNTVSDTQVITVFDSEAPEISGVPADVNTDMNSIPEIANVTATDNCSDVEVEFNETENSLICGYQIIRTWTSTDNCGNTTEETQIITVSDNVPPVGSELEDVTIEYGSPIPTEEPTFTDDSDQTLEINFNEVQEDLECGYQIIRTWTATDDCGNMTEIIQVITVTDTTNPELIGVPANEELDCSENIANAIVVAQDNSGIEIQVVLESVTEELECGYQIIRTWTAIDHCENMTSATQVSVFTDTSAPTVDFAPENTSIECGEDAPSGEPVFSDDCSEPVTLTFNEELTNFGSCGYDIVRTWTATDECGNQSEYTQIINVTDTTEPEMIGCPDDAIVQCNEIPDAPSISAIDNCDDDVNVAFSEQLDNSQCPYEIIRTWSATDACGNTISDSQIITVIDDEAPELIGIPDDMNATENTIPSVAVVTASDNCWEVTPEFAETTNNLLCGYEIVRTWTVTDLCGNSSLESQTITVSDDIPPTVTSSLGDITVECGNTIPASEATFEDESDSDLELSFDEQTNNLNCGYEIVRTWSATDDCGNTTETTQTITITDTTAPNLLGVPADETLNCDEELTNAIVVAEDNCDENLTVSLESQTIDAECGYQIIRTWSVMDECGNNASQSQTVTFEDTEGPQAIDVPNDTTIECGTSAPTDTPSFTDNCDEQLDIEFTEEMNNQTACGFDIVKTWTATDDCDNQTTVVQVITVTDTTSPDLNQEPEDLVVDCNAIPEVALVTAVDDCDDDVQVVYNEQINDGTCPYTIVRTWVATDACGNQSSTSQTLTVQDNTAPVLAGVPSSFNTMNGDIPEAPEVTVTDDCSEVEVDFQEVQNNLACGYQIVRTWTATDECDNSTVESYTITVSDNQPPVASDIPSDLIVECGDEIPFSEPSFTDDLTEDVSVSFEEETLNMACGYQVIRTWLGTDECENSTEVSQIISIVDTTAPGMTGVPENEELNCGEMPTEVNIEATDACDDEVEISLNIQEIDSDCGYQIVRTWTAVDDCGNTSVETQTSTYVDTQAPIANNVPEDITIECNDQLPLSQPTFLDNCEGELSVSYSQENENFNPCGYNVVRTWTAEDVCGNVTEVSQVVTFQDSTAPILTSFPENVNAFCDDIPSVSPVSAIDNCDDDVSVSFEETTEGEGCTYTVVRTWTATDLCGNSSTHQQILTITDNTAPIVVAELEDFSIGCNGELPEDSPVFEDNCDQNLDIELTEETLGGFCNRQIIRTWTASDECGNQVSSSQTILMFDSEAPVISNVPEDMVVNCGDTVPFHSVMAEDNCTEDVGSIYNVETVELACGYQEIRTWTSTDDCNNSSHGIQVITYEDTEAPVATNIPLDVSLECSESEPTDSPDFTDACDDELDVDFIIVVSNESVCGYTKTKTWTASDECGNETSITQVIEVTDSQAPEFVSAPEDVTVQCDQVPAFNEIEATDNCDEFVSVEMSEELNSSECPYSLVRTWTASDDCGNSNTHTQIITIVDDSAPELNGIPTDMEVNCGEIPQVPEVTASDNCDQNVDVEFEETSENVDCNLLISRTWTAIDQCGNTSSQTQSITVVDNMAPVLLGVPENTSISCGFEPAESSVSAIDNCDDDVEVELSEETILAECGYLIVRTWTSTDACGNTASAEQVVNVLDNQGPVFDNVPENLFVQCDELPDFEQLAAQDACSSSIEIVTEEVQQALTCGFLITRTWTAIDGCGNETEVSQEITVEDTESPEISGIPEDITVNCGEIPAFSTVDATDNCDTTPEITVTDEVSYQGCIQVISRIYRATDDCGNTAFNIQTITVVDNEAPLITEAPADLMVECGDLPEPALIGATDNCDDDVQVIFSEETIGEDCPFTIVRTWEAIDACGNTSITSQTLTVSDSEAPSFGELEAEVYVNCEEFNGYTIEATDNCDDDVEVTHEDLFFSGGCFGVRQRTWTATDNCGNQATAVQFIRQIDDVLPEIFNIPENLTVECGEDVPQISTDVYAIDNCDDDVEISFVEEITSDFCPYIITRTWIAVDECGNSVEGTQVITIDIDTPEQVEIFSYPNPFNDSFTVNFSVPQNAQVRAQVVDGMGRTVSVVFDGQADGHRLYEYTLSGLDWEPGSYTLMMVVGNQVHHHKLMVQQR